MKLLVTDLAGKEHSVEARLNWTLMEIIRDGDLPIRAECGGSCACATCHVYVAPDWLAKLPAMEESERDTLEGGFEVEPNSRLSCQLIMTAELDGMRATLSQDAAG
jgi:2Fe-2S ferredoxin